MPSKWEIKKHEPGVHRVEITGENAPGMWVHLSSDWHIDNPKARMDIIENDLKQCQQVGGMALVAGDMLDVMGGKYDKRSSKDALRPEHQHGSYLDRVVDTTAEFLKPYAANMGLITQGNHETAIFQRHETCLITRIVERLRAWGSPCQSGGYNGWVQFYARSKSGKASAQWHLYYHHGSGGDSPSTMGIGSLQKVNMFVNADAILSGHIHSKNLSHVCRERLTSMGKREVSETALVRTSTYKNEYEPLNGWHIEKGRGPRPFHRPGYWLKLKMNNEKTKLQPSFHDIPTEEHNTHELPSHHNKHTRARATSSDTKRGKRKSEAGSRAKGGSRKSNAHK